MTADYTHTCHRCGHLVAHCTCSLFDKASCAACPSLALVRARDEGGEQVREWHPQIAGYAGMCGDCPSLARLKAIEEALDYVMTSGCSFGELCALTTINDPSGSAADMWIKLAGLLRERATPRKEASK